MIPESTARTVIANTHISVLLSTNKRNAHIPLVIHNKIPIHQAYNHIFSTISFFSLDTILTIYHMNSFTNPRPKTRTNSPLKKFIDTAMLSGDSRNQDFIGCISEKKKEM